MARAQLSLFRESGAMPEGLAYRRDLIDAAEERALAERIAALELKPFEFHGFTGHRRTVSFGWHYAFDGSGLKPAEPIPDWLLPVRAAAADLAGDRTGLGDDRAHVRATRSIACWAVRP
jgi:hypothetical protein